ncbi:MAG: ATP-binding protein [Bacteroidota bacterium]
MSNSSSANCLVLDQYRIESTYNDFIGKFYHFPEKYLKLLSQPDIEFVYYEPKRNGKGEYFGYGKIIKPPFEDKREKGFYFVEISGFKNFSKPVPFEENNIPREKPPFYNPQNAVRRINKNDLEGISLDGGIMLSFRADTHLMRVLGEELIATEKVGILELIKNSYDAHASFCKIRIENVPGLAKISEYEYKYPYLEGPVIIIEDDGDGMDWFTIEEGWLRPASTIKTAIKERLKKEREQAIISGKLGTYESLLNKLKKEHGGRLPLGEKGVGRFATRRLGRNLTIRTKVKANEYEYVLNIDWDTFDKRELDGPKDLDSVGISLFREKPSRNYGKNNSGTQIIVWRSREGFELTEASIKELNRTILQLKSPFKSPGEFVVQLECPQVTDLDTSLITEEFESTFSFDGIVDSDGVCDLELKFKPPRSVPMIAETIHRPSFDLKSGEDIYWNGRKPECGPFYVHLDIWYRTTPWIEGKTKELTDYLDNFGGVAIYRDGLNIFSSAEGTLLDWLNLSVRHIKRGLRISYYAMLGSVDIEQGNNITLIDKTNREGMLKNTAFQDLSHLIRSIILFIENIYVGKRDDYNKLTGDVVRDPEKLTTISKEASAIIGSIAENYDLKKDPFDLIAKIGKKSTEKEHLVNLASSLKKLQSSLIAIEEVQDLLTEQAGYGLAVAISVHEISKLTTDFYNQVIEFSKAGKLNKDKIDTLNKAAASLKSELRRLGPLRAIKTEIPITFNVIKSVQFAVAVHRRKLEKSEIEVKTNFKKGFEIFGRFGALNQVFSNLLSNSRYWLDENKTRNKQILIDLDEDYKTILFADNGPGIDDSILPHLFQVGYSLKKPPSGLGLYICKYYMHDIRGDIYLASEKEKHKKYNGAQFILDFHKVQTGKGRE